jgi:LysM repeat protein
MKHILPILKKVLPIVIALVLLQMVIVPASQAAPPASGGGNYGGGNYNCGNCYRVKYGDTLFSIGRRFHVNPYYIAQVNGLYNPNHIYAGQFLRIPSGYGDCYQGCGRGNYGSGYYGQDCNFGCGRGYDRYNSRWQDCNSGCGNDYGRSKFSQGYGYDYSGYYYDANYNQGGYNRYSYTCGYYYNCY